MSTFVFKCLLLCALMSGTVCCMPKNYTLRIEKNDCAQCVAINTTICSGYCYTQVRFDAYILYCIVVTKTDAILRWEDNDRDTLKHNSKRKNLYK